ncbi:hypothetical protein A33Q_0106 [Indibacter alkaliphilus LW1]|uniref:Uncharacterized protein n=1 Tax=Indibacter alkaliphilus (strain CCUG 57479 / KCTC 22604 / LW1) TaxID=1189612 RepID=S2DM90_INDAL|nr:hypothetical protein A33Q_0106 [Indibacter alkaliphilus LW1]
MGREAFLFKKGKAYGKLGEIREFIGEIFYGFLPIRNSA